MSKTPRQLTVPRDDLRPGQFFMSGGRWYRAYTTVIPVEGKSWPKIQAASATFGKPEWMWLHDERVTVNERNDTPGTFQPSALDRKARDLRKKAAALLSTADQLENLATDLRLNTPVTAA